MLQSRHKAMAVVVLLFLISLLDSVEGAENRFVRSGSTLLLEAKTTKLGNEDFIWKFNTNINLVKFRSGGDTLIKYEKRTVFSTQNYSLQLRNMQHNDTGNYKEIISGVEDKTIAEYTVRVQDPVSPVKLTVTPSDPGCYNFTATCRTADSQISGSFQCENKTCRLLDQTDLKDSSLNVSVKESSIICNYSNQVSWKQDVKNVSSLCENPPVFNNSTGITVGVLVVAFIMCLVIIICIRKRSAKTVCEVPQETPQNHPYECPAEITGSSSPTSTYALVQFPNPRVKINVTSTSANQQPETIYGQVNKAAKFKAKSAAAFR